MKVENIGKIKIVQACSCGGSHLDERTILKVPQDISLANAKQLITLKRAVIMPPPGAEEKPEDEQGQVDEKVPETKKAPVAEKKHQEEQKKSSK